MTEQTLRLKECMTHIGSVLTVCLCVIRSDTNNSPSLDYSAWRINAIQEKEEKHVTVDVN